MIAMNKFAIDNLSLHVQWKKIKSAYSKPLSPVFSRLCGGLKQLRVITNKISRSS